MTSGMAALSLGTQARVLTAVRTFTAFSEDNDPWGEHGFGAVAADGEKVFFKIDCLCPSRPGAPVPSIKRAFLMLTRPTIRRRWIRHLRQGMTRFDRSWPTFLTVFARGYIAFQAEYRA